MPRKSREKKEWINTIESQNDTGATIIHKNAKRKPWVILVLFILPTGFFILTIIHFAESSGTEPRYGFDYTGLVCVAGTALFFVVSFWGMLLRFRIVTIIVDATEGTMTLMRRYRERGKNKVTRIFGLKAIDTLKYISYENTNTKPFSLKMNFKDGRKKILLYGNNYREVQEIGNAIVKYI